MSMTDYATRKHGLPISKLGQVSSLTGDELVVVAVKEDSFWVNKTVPISLIWELLGDVTHISLYVESLNAYVVYRTEGSLKYRGFRNDEQYSATIDILEDDESFDLNSDEILVCGGTGDNADVKVVYIKNEGDNPFATSYSKLMVANWTGINPPESFTLQTLITLEDEFGGEVSPEFSGRPWARCHNGLLHILVVTTDAFELGGVYFSQGVNHIWDTGSGFQIEDVAQTWSGGPCMGGFTPGGVLTAVFPFGASYMYGYKSGGTWHVEELRDFLLANGYEQNGFIQGFSVDASGKIHAIINGENSTTGEWETMYTRKESYDAEWNTPTPFTATGNREVNEFKLLTSSLGNPIVVESSREPSDPGDPSNPLRTYIHEMTGGSAWTEEEITESDLYNYTVGEDTDVGDWLDAQCVPGHGSQVAIAHTGGNRLRLFSNASSFAGN
jgi:hypothetical protein